MKKKFSVLIGAVALLALMMAGTANACVGPGLSPGFWKHNLGVYLSGGTNYSDPGVTGTVADGPSFAPTKENFADWFAALAELENLEQAYADLNLNGGGAIGAATRVDAANIFNYYADLFDY